MLPEEDNVVRVDESHNSAEVYYETKKYTEDYHTHTSVQSSNISKEPINYSKTEFYQSDKILSNDVRKDPAQPRLWLNIFGISLLHFVAVTSFLAYTFEIKLITFLWGCFLGGVGGVGVTAGVHRLWTHRSYKAKWQLRVFLAILYSVAGQNTIYDWVRDHRVHHKFSETDADPHNSNRGFFFAHVGWLMQRKHPDVLRKGKQIDMSDILTDPVVVFHQKYFTLIKTIFCFMIPVLVPYYCWDEDLYYSFLSMGIVRYTINLNFTWLVNSAAHMWGNKPFDRYIQPSENLAVAMVSMGEGWHNYHHVFPWDYKAAELGSYTFNLTTAFIDFFAKIGWAYDLKQPSPDLVKRVVEKSGDGSHPVWGHSIEVPDPEELKSR